LIGGTPVAFATNVSAFVGSFETLVAIRALAGIGTGIVGAAGTASAASSREPDRLSAAAMLVWGFGGGGYARGHSLRHSRLRKLWRILADFGRLSDLVARLSLVDSSAKGKR